MEEHRSSSTSYHPDGEEQIIEVGPGSNNNSRVERTLLCSEVEACGFMDARTFSKDAKERRVTMRKLLIAVGLCLIFMSAEVVGGIKANSLAILTDAAHLLSDVVGFAISLFSLWAAGWEATPRQSFGFFRIEILGALVSIQLIWLLTGILVYEAVFRLVHESGEVNGLLMLVVAGIGLVVNIIMAFVLGHGHSHGHGHGHGHGGHDDHGSGSDSHSHDEEDQTPGTKNHENEHVHRNTKRRKKAPTNINVRGAYLHVLGDSVQSVGVLIGGAIIWRKPEWKIVDLICTLVFSLIVLGTTFRMLRSIIGVLMERTPREIDIGSLEKGLSGMDGVVAIHELHTWAITVGKILLSCHVKVSPEADPDEVLDKVLRYVKIEHNISHATVQIEH